MSYTNSTPNYKLPQYVGTDKPTFLGDFNNAMTIIDTQMHTNAKNAGEGIASLQDAQAQLTETQSTLTEVQSEVANVSGIASTVTENVQQALSAANDASEAATQAQSQIQPAVAAANQASADAQAAQQVANGNVATISSLSERVSALEGLQILEISGTVESNSMHPNIVDGTRGCTFTIAAPSGTSVESVTTNTTSFTNPGTTSFVAIKAGETTLATYNNSKQMTGTQKLDAEGNETSVTFNVEAGPQADFVVNFSYTVKFKKVSE